MSQNDFFFFFELLLHRKLSFIRVYTRGQVITAAWIALLERHQSNVRESQARFPARPDQHLGSLSNCGEAAAFALTSADG